jgi:hypothetical protein
MKAYNITGKQWDLFHQVDAFNAICPVLLKDGKWVIPEDAVKYYENFYLNADEHTKANSPIHDEDKLAMVQIIVNKIRKFPQVDITEADQHPIQNVRKQEPILDEKLLVEDFLKETLAANYSATDTIAQALIKIEAKAQPIKEQI